MLHGILGEDIVKNAGVIEIFRDRNIQRFIQSFLFSCPKIQTVIKKKHSAHNQCKQNRKTKIPHTGYQTGSHRKKQRANLFCCSRNRTKADKTEGSGNCHTGSYISIDQHDHNTDDCGEQSKCYNKAFGITGTIHIADSHDKTEHKGQAQT